MAALLVIAKQLTSTVDGCLSDDVLGSQRLHAFASCNMAMLPQTQLLDPAFRPCLLSIVQKHSTAQPVGTSLVKALASS